MSSADSSSNSRDQPSVSQEFRKPSPDLMRQVLEETLARGDAGLTPEEWQAVRQIALVHAQCDLPIDQVALMPVTTLLATRFPELGDEAARQRMCSCVTGSLCGDPTSMQRLKNFWQQLRESVQ